MQKINFHTSTVEDCQLVQLPKIHNPAGNITVISNHIEVPFEIKRVYYLYDIPGGEMRGGHAHKELYQLIVAAGGSFDVMVNDGNFKKTVHLNRPYSGLIIVPGIWRELENFSSGATCLVLASHNYNEEDYLRDFENYNNLKNGKK